VDRLDPSGRSKKIVQIDVAIIFIIAIFIIAAIALGMVNQNRKI
jgi:hypothetical protein